MNRIFIEKIIPEDNKIILDDPSQVHHLKNVVRIKPQEPAVVFDGTGREFLVLVLEVGRIIKLGIKEERKDVRTGIRITVACAIPKNVKMDDIVDKLTQLGVEKIIPLETERVIVRLNAQKKIERRKRWEKIVLSSLKQSQQNRLVEIGQISNLVEIIAFARNFDLKLIPTLEGQRSTIREILENFSKKIENVIILIGPEGDFSPNEIALAKEAGFIPASLGKNTLRVDTAAIAAVSFLKLYEN